MSQETIVAAMKANKRRPLTETSECPLVVVKPTSVLITPKHFSMQSRVEGEENFVGDSEIIALGGASNETKDRPLG